MHEGFSGSFGLSPLAPILQGLSTTNLKKLAGNSMHLVSQSAFMLYILCNVVPREQPAVRSMRVYHESKQADVADDLDD